MYLLYEITTFFCCPRVMSLSQLLDSPDLEMPMLVPRKCLNPLSSRSSSTSTLFPFNVNHWWKCWTNQNKRRTHKRLPSDCQWPVSRPTPPSDSCTFSVSDRLSQLHVLLQNPSSQAFNSAMFFLSCQSTHHPDPLDHLSFFLPEEHTLIPWHPA